MSRYIEPERKNSIKKLLSLRRPIKQENLWAGLGIGMMVLGGILDIPFILEPWLQIELNPFIGLFGMGLTAGGAIFVYTHRE